MQPSQEKAAQYYLQKKLFSVIPCGDNKKPLIKWQEYQDRLASPEEVADWFTRFPKANIGIVTGRISNLAVVDIDEEQGYTEIAKLIPENIPRPVACTPSGGHHWYFRMPDKGIRLNVRTVPGCDLRADGGYVVAPPSKNTNGVYSWMENKSIKNTDISKLPDSYVDFVTNVTNEARLSQGCHSDVTTKVLEMFVSGRRDNDIFHTANCLLKGGMAEENARQVVKILADYCKFPQSEIDIKIASALQRAIARERNLKAELDEYLSVTSGDISVTDCYIALQVVTKEDKAAIRQMLHRKMQKNILEKHPVRGGVYRVVDSVLEEIDWMSSDDDEFDLALPLGLNNLVKIMPKNLIVVAGSPNSGKTAFLLDIVFKNIKNKRINYFSSEMSNAELKGRLKAFGEPLEKWRNGNFNAFDRCSNFADVIRPNDVNIIDFLEIHDEFWKVGSLLKDLYEKLDKGICIIALQKKRGSDTGKGGDVTREKPRLYLTMDNGQLCIEKGKNWKHENVNPNNLMLNFKLVQGSKFLEAGQWAYKDGRPLEVPGPYTRHYTDDSDF